MRSFIGNACSVANAHTNISNGNKDFKSRSQGKAILTALLGKCTELRASKQYFHVTVTIEA
jgi:hypothetical protein